MNRLKNVIISLLSLALCVAVTFAWINELQNPGGRVLTLKLNNATVADSELEVKLSVNVEDDVFDDITKLQSVVSQPTLESYDNFAPGSRKKFRVDITNLSEASVTLQVILSDIVCENEELQNNIVIGTNGFAGFNSDYPAPSVQNKTLADGIDASGGFSLVDGVEIPPHNVDAPVSIYFYVMFSAAGSENLEDMTFSIGTINFLTI
ncbi:MAG: hypothetical protein E7586_03870 [Ruminococcaceae bacterium]|nr:hypothetical protein [Oscillospiraceae bacterium]